MKPTIIFDFDGTIADTFEVIKKILIDLSSEFKYKVPTDEEIVQLKAMHPLKAMQTIGFSPLKLPFLLKKLHAEQHKQIKNVQPIAGMKNALLELKSANYSLGIVSSATEKNVQFFLKNHDLDIFDFIETGSSLFGKAQVLSKVIKKQQLVKNNTIYMGDEIRDIEAAKKVGIKIIAVTWGFNDKKGLHKFTPDVMVDKPSDLLRQIKVLSNSKV